MVLGGTGREVGGGRIFRPACDTIIAKRRIAFQRTLLELNITQVGMQLKVVNGKS